MLSPLANLDFVIGGRYGPTYVLHFRANHAISYVHVDSHVLRYNSTDYYRYRILPYKTADRIVQFLQVPLGSR